LEHLYTADAGCLYAGMSLGSTKRTSPGEKDRSLCLNSKVKAISRIK